MYNLKEGDSVVLNTDDFESNQTVGEVLEVYSDSTRVKVRLEGGATAVLPANQLTKRSFLSE